MMMGAFYYIMINKKNIRLIVLFALLFIVESCVLVRAERVNATLSVIGRIISPKNSCAIETSGGNIYKVGDISHTTLNRYSKVGNNISLPAIAKQWIITCSKSTYLSMTAIDENNVSAHIPKNSFSLSNGNKLIGHFFIKMSDMLADDKHIFVSDSHNNAKGAKGAKGTRVSPQVEHFWVNSDGQNVKGTVFQTELSITPTLYADKVNESSDNIEDINGSVTLNFAYGI